VHSECCLGNHLEDVGRCEDNQVGGAWTECRIMLGSAFGVDIAEPQDATIDRVGW
jgi:hypothetical protein